MLRELCVCASFSPAVFVGTAVALASYRRRAARAEDDCGTPASRDTGSASPAPPSIEDAERQLGILLRRMRAYLQSPYDFAASRIRSAAEFERCLDLATALYLALDELSGAPPATAADRERVRDQVTLSLSARPAPPVSRKPGRPVAIS